MATDTAAPSILSPAPPATTLRGGALVAAWLGVIVTTIVTLASFAIAIPRFLEYFRRDQFATFDGLGALGLSAGAYAATMITIEGVEFVSCIVVAVTIVWHKPTDWVALLTALVLLLFSVSMPLFRIVMAPDRPPLDHLTMFVAAATVTTLMPLLYVFPDGRLVPRWTRWFTVVWLVWTPLWVMFPNTPLNPYTWPPPLILVCQLVSVSSGIVAQGIRYQQYASLEQRQQTKWVLFGWVVGTGAFLVLAALAVMLPWVGEASAGLRLAYVVTSIVATLALITTPVCFAVAILRFRLWEIDRVINRTLVYGALTATLVIVYAGSVVALQQLIIQVTGQRSDLAIAASTLTTVVLFQPLRTRVQTAVDRRFFRRRFDAGQAIARFGATVRDDVDLDHVATSLCRVVDDTLQPTVLWLWVDQVDSTVIGSWPVDVAPDKPLRDELLAHPDVQSVQRLAGGLAAAAALQAVGGDVIVPLISQGDLVGLVGLGRRRDGRPYSADDRALLSTLAIQAAPAVRVAQLARRQQAEAVARERLEQELLLARQLTQEIETHLTLTPDDLPNLAGWDVTVTYQPARIVGGDFYDLLALADGRFVIVVGDAAGKGVPAALFMATTRSVLRSESRRLTDPAAVLARVNESLCLDKPRGMFATCFYGVLDPATGRFRFANAGHDLPFHRHAGGATTLTATGMPLGLLPDSRYDEGEAVLAPGDALLFVSDGLVEAHDPRGGMFGIDRVATQVREHAGGSGLIDAVLDDLHTFTGPGWEQEDDLTLVLLQRSGMRADPTADAWTTLRQFSAPSVVASERQVLDDVLAALAPLDLPGPTLERVRTAVGEAAANAIEHGNCLQADVPVEVVVQASRQQVRVSITDLGGAAPVAAAAPPNLAAKLRGDEPPRGWGLFLMHAMVDDMSDTRDGPRHTVELVFNRGLDGDAA